MEYQDRRNLKRHLRTLQKDRKRIAAQWIELVQCPVPSPEPSSTTQSYNLTGALMQELDAVDHQVERFKNLLGN